MSDPRRLKHDDELVATLLGAAKRYEPSVRSRKKTLKLLGLPLSLSLAATLGQAGATAATAAGWGAKVWLVATVVVGVGGATGVVGGMVLTRAHRDRPVLARSVSQAAAPRQPSLAPEPLLPSDPHVVMAAEPQSPSQGEQRPLPQIASRSAVRAAAVAKLAPARVEDAVKEHAPIARLEPAPIEPQQSAFVQQPAGATLPVQGLAEELVVLSRATHLLQTGQAQFAIDELRVFQDRFPRGHMHQEAWVMRIEALRKLGALEAAKRAARDFLVAYPSSVLSRRVMSGLNAADSRR